MAYLEDTSISGHYAAMDEERCARAIITYNSHYKCNNSAYQYPIEICVTLINNRIYSNVFKINLIII